MLGIIMLDPLIRELVHALLLGWAAYGCGKLLSLLQCNDFQSKFLSNALFFVSPFVLTCFAIHATIENQELAAVLTAKESGEVNGRIYLTSISHTNLGDGITCRTEYYSDGTASTSTEMSPAIRRMGRISDEAKESSFTGSGDKKSLRRMYHERQSDLDRGIDATSLF
jgi:hypothetical protein